MLPKNDPGRLAAAALRRIERHRQSSSSGLGVCRFEPSCSHYAESALHERAFPVAVLVIASRLLRCNPLAVRRAADPLHHRRPRPRANTVPTLFAILALSGLVFIATEGIANAVGVSGGCNATVNGADPSSLTRDNPLVVHKHESVDFRGSVPASAAAAAGGHLNSNTHVDVDVVSGVFGVTSSDHPGTGPQWGGTESVDQYLKYGVGLYHVKGVATGDGGWTCVGDGYIQLEDGSPLEHPVGEGAAAVVVLGGVGAALSAMSSGEEHVDTGYDDDPASDSTYDPAVIDYNATQVVRRDGVSEAAAAFGCLLILLVTILGMHAASASMAAPAAAPRKRRIWVRGHPVLGTLSGLLLGLGATVLLQQYAYWTLTITTAIVFPVVVAIVCGIRAYIGAPKKVVSRT